MFVLLVTANAMHCDMIKMYCRSGRRQEYFNVVCYYKCNALRFDIEILLVWTAAGIRLCCLLLQL